MKKTFTATGKIDENGNYALFGINQLLDFFKNNPNSSLLCTFEVNETQSINAMLRYYNVKIIKDVQKALYENGNLPTRECADKMLKSISPITCDGKRLRSLSELSRDELIQFLDQVREFSLSELNIVFSDARTL